MRGTYSSTCSSGSSTYYDCKPGFGGHTFIPEMMSKVEQVVELRQKGGYSFDIEVDGGVDNKTIAACAKAGLMFL